VQSKKIKNEMKQKFKKENSPRLKNAIKRAFAYSGQLWYFPINMLGELILYYAYGADKYDVLNALCPGIRGKVITFIRGDIRHKKKRTCFGGIAREITLLLIVILVLLLSNDW
jgi:hypothetical protein